MRNVLIVMLGTIALATVAADAAPRHKHKHGRVMHPVAVRGAPAQLFPNRPAWSSPYDCFTDEGYGRFWPCGAGRSN